MKIQNFFQKVQSSGTERVKCILRLFQKLQSSGVLDWLLNVSSFLQPLKEKQQVQEDDSIKQQIKLLEKQIKQNKQDIEKVTRAEIQSR